MQMKHLVTAAVLLALVFAPAYAQMEPGTGDETALDVIADHEDTSLSYAAFADEFAEYLDDEDQVAFFAPTDDVLEELGIEEASIAELQEVFTRHATTGLAAEIPIEVVEWFGTLDGSQNEVALEDDTPVINDTAEVVEAVPAENGIVYVIDDTL